MLLRSSNVSFLNSLRVSKFWLSFEGVFKIFAGSLGAFIEYMDMVTTANYVQSHYDHIGMLGIFVLLGVIDLLHLYNVLRDPIWCMMSPVGFIYLGVQFGAHEQPTDLRLRAHNINALILILAGLSRAAEMMISLHTNKKYHTAVLKKELLEESNSKPWNIRSLFSNVLLCRGCFRPSHEIITGVNSIYTNPRVYATIFPMFTAMLLIFDGFWWWDMGLTLFRGPPDMDMENGHHAMSKSFSMVGRDLMIELTVVAFTSLVLYQIDKRFFPKESHALQMKVLGNSPVLDVEADNQMELSLAKFNIE